MLLNNPTHPAQEKPQIQPRLSLSSSTQSNDEQNTKDVLHSKQKSESNLSQSKSAEPEKQNITDGIMKDPQSIPRRRVRSPFESLLVKPLNETTTPQISPKNLENEDRKSSKGEYEKTEEKERDHSLSITGTVKYIILVSEIFYRYGVCLQKYLGEASYK